MNIHIFLGRVVLKGLLFVRTLCCLERVD